MTIDDDDLRNFSLSRNIVRLDASTKVADAVLELATNRADWAVFSSEQGHYAVKPTELVERMLRRREVDLDVAHLLRFGQSKPSPCRIEDLDFRLRWRGRLVVLDGDAPSAVATDPNRDHPKPFVVVARDPFELTHIKESIVRSLSDRGVAGTTTVDTPVEELIGGFLDGLGPQFGADAARTTRVEMSDERAAPEAPAAESGAAEFAALISAEADSQIELGDERAVQVRVERKHAGALPLAARREAVINSREQIYVHLMAPAEIHVPVDVLRLDPPTGTDPVLSFFAIRGLEEGRFDLTLLFRQGSKQLGSLELRVQVVRDRTVETKEAAQQAVPVTAPDDDDVLVLEIGEEAIDGAIHVTYRAWGGGLGLSGERFRSGRLGERGYRLEVVRETYLGALVEALRGALRPDPYDLERSRERVAALGADLCDRVFSPALVEALWERRSDIHKVQVQVQSKLRAIPWEILTLCRPREADDRCLAEAGLVRSLPGGHPRRLPGARWRYLAASYPNRMADAVDEGASYFRTQLGLHGIAAEQILADPPENIDRAFLAALEDGSFDVLHVVCHGKGAAEPGFFELIVGDRRQADATPKVIAVTSFEVSAQLKRSAGIEERRPIVFLNACESSRLASAFGDYGGWPEIFCKAGASAFVGTQWPVRLDCAALFAQEFYERLLAGDVLSTAAAKARAAAKNGTQGASWLAYSVYGHPSATLDRVAAV